MAKTESKEVKAAVATANKAADKKIEALKKSYEAKMKKAADAATAKIAKTKADANAKILAAQEKIKNQVAGIKDGSGASDKSNKKAKPAKETGTKGTSKDLGEYSKSHQSKHNAYMSAMASSPRQASKRGILDLVSLDPTPNNIEAVFSKDNTNVHFVYTENGEAIRIPISGENFPISG